MYQAADVFEERVTVRPYFTPPAWETQTVLTYCERRVHNKSIRSATTGSLQWKHSKQKKPSIFQRVNVPPIL